MIEQLREMIGPEVKENEPLAQYTTFKIGGPAKFYVEVDNKQTLQKTLQAAVTLKLPYFFLGGGSNILISDDGIDGLVIRFLPGEFEVKGNKVTVFSGNSWATVVRDIVKADLEGLEPCGNVPGSVGGAVRGNAGAYGVNTGDFVEQVEALIVGETEVSLKVLSKEDCKFEYRHSIFKDNPNWVVVEAVLNIPNANRSFEERMKQVDDELESRHKKHPMDLPNAGSTFKNIIYTEELSQFKDWETYGKIPAARFIEDAGLKGFTLGGAQVSKKHANILVNYDDATADEMIQLISLVKMKVRDQYKVQLMEELQYIGFN